MIIIKYLYGKTKKDMMKILIYIYKALTDN